MIKIIINFLFFMILFFIYGCSPAGVIASGGATTMVVAEGERSLGSLVDDATIKLNLSAKFLQSENNLFVNINSNVLEGRVLLTGIVNTQEIRIESVRKVWEIEGVIEVINEIENLRSTSVFFVSGKRLVNFLKNILEKKINRTITICKEITKKNERVFRGKTKNIIDEILMDKNNIKGEFVVIIEGKEKKSIKKVDVVIEKQMMKLLKKFSLTDVVEIVHKLTNISKKEIYKSALLYKND